MEEVRSLGVELEKCDSEERLVDILKALEKAPVTLGMLHSLKLGPIVAKFRKHENGDVSSAAKGLVKKWKDMATAAGVKSERGFTTEVSETRSKSRDHLLKILGGGKCHDVAESVEAIVHAQHPDNPRDYAAKLRQLFSNLKKNQSLRERLVVSRQVSPQQLCDMSVDELATVTVLQEREQARKDQHDARSLDWQKKNRDQINKSIGIDDSNGMFQCSNCKSRRIAIAEKQTRSADEPMTQFFECIDCGKRWRT